jgi:hypothetical protein
MRDVFQVYQELPEGGGRRYCVPGEGRPAHEPQVYNLETIHIIFLLQKQKMKDHSYTPFS